jgi:hypothetical protein
MERGPDGFLNRPEQWVANSGYKRFGPNRPEPVMDGFETVQKIMNGFPPIPSIIFIFIFYILIPILATANLFVFRPEIRPSMGFGWIRLDLSNKRERSCHPVPVIPFLLSSQGSFKVSQAVVPFPPTIQIQSLVFNCRL